VYEHLYETRLSSIWPVYVWPAASFCRHLLSPGFVFIDIPLHLGKWLRTSVGRAIGAGLGLAVCILDWKQISTI
jgi:hypothetical protein